MKEIIKKSLCCSRYFIHKNLKIIKIKPMQCDSFITIRKISIENKNTNKQTPSMEL